MKKAAYYSISLSFFLLANFAYASHPTILCPNFTRSLAFGSKGDEVKTLQQFLAYSPASGPDIYPEGLVTGYFGRLTESAIQRFQAREGVISSGLPSATGYGIFGPKTRAKFREVCDRLNFSHGTITPPTLPAPAPTPLPEAPAPAPQTQPTATTTTTPTPIPPPTPTPPPVVTGSYEGTTCILDVEPKVAILGKDRPEATWSINSGPSGWYFYWHEIIDGVDQGDFQGGKTNKSVLVAYEAKPAKHTRYAHVVIEQNHIPSTGHSSEVCTTNTVTMEIK